MEFTLSEAWKRTYPGAAVGVLAMSEVANPRRHELLAERKKELEQELRTQYAGWDRAALKGLPVLQAYREYYKRFKKTYHVQLQLESIVFKGKAIAEVAALVEAMFMAELKNLLLTAGHDVAALQAPVGIDVASGNERYVRLNGQKQQLKAGDMMISDGEGVISSILHGPDSRTRITPDSHHILFTVYAPPGIEPEAVRAHLRDLQSNALIIAPAAQVDLLQVHMAE